eukprot:scaffold2502_cov362-Prasinococcus_capsulatus_cf.AAC.5
MEPGGGRAAVNARWPNLDRGIRGQLWLAAVRRCAAVNGPRTGKGRSTLLRGCELAVESQPVLLKAGAAWVATNQERQCPIPTSRDGTVEHSR